MVTHITDEAVTLATIVMVVIFSTCGVHGYADGNIPASACQSMFPDHGAPAKTSPSPYSVTVSKTSYNPGDTVTVTIAGGEFEGFMVEARRADPSLNTLEALGTFTPVTNTHQLCNGGALSHTDQFDRTSISFEWIAPTDAQGHIQFRATVVEEEKDFWVDVLSPIVRDPTAPDISETPPAQNCGSAAGCFSYPTGCQGDACVASITWTPEGFTTGRKRRQTATTPAYVDITLTGDTDGYVAVGLSTDQSMGTDSVMECVNDGGTVRARMSYNEGLTNQENKFTDGISDVTGSVVNGRVTCSFRRLTSVPGNSKIFPLDTAYYLLIAMGAMSGGNKVQHTTTLSSSSKYRLTEASTGGGGAATGSGYGLVQAHAILMVAAWLLTGCLGMMMARYYKQGWPDKTMCGTKVWFNVHRVLMILTLFLTLAGFIVIFIHVKGYSGHLEGFLAAHPPLGIVVTALVIINPIMAACRPHPGTSKRTMFNWAHWAVANLALILAVICIGFGFYIPTVAAFAPGYLFWIFIGMIVFQALVWIVLDIHRCMSNSRTKKENNLQLKDRQDMGEQVPPAPTNTGSTFRYFMLAIFILGTLGFFLAIAVLLCI